MRNAEHGGGLVQQGEERVGGRKGEVVMGDHLHGSFTLLYLHHVTAVVTLELYPLPFACFRTGAQAQRHR